MLESMIKQTFKGSNSASIYRHFKGGYYLVLSTATVEDTQEEVVVYQSLQDGKVWTRPISVFQEPVPEGKLNPTGQKMRFERVSNFNNQLGLISTDELARELVSRNDNPFEGINLDIENSKIWKVQFLTGVFESIFVDNETTFEDFDVDCVHDTLENAISRVEKSCNSRMQILKQVLIKQDF